MATIGDVKRTPATVCEFEWSITEFASLSAEDYQYYCSPSFEVLGKSCILFIYPNGLRSSSPSEEQKDTLGYVVIGFLLPSSQTPPIVPEVSFAIKNAKGNKDQERHNPCQLLSSNSLLYSAYRYISRTELLERPSELMPSNILTVICTVKYTESMDSKIGDSETSTCKHCAGILHAKAISFHEKNCRHKLVKCPECSEVVSLRSWSYHECHSTKKAGETGSAKCKHCQELVDAKKMSLHEKKCLIKCPKCSEVVALKNWHDHECQTTKPEGLEKLQVAVALAIVFIAIVAACIYGFSKTPQLPSHGEGEEKLQTLEINKIGQSDVSGLEKYTAAHSNQNGDTKLKISGKSKTLECTHCKGVSDAKAISFPEKNRWLKPVKCSENSEVLSLGDWCDHVCQSRKKADDGSLGQDLMKMLSDGRNHDLIIKIGDKALRAHKDILSCRSRVFASMLEHDMKEKNSGVINVPDCDPQAMEVFLSYVYTGKVEALDQSSMLGLYYIADKYDMQGLKKESADYIRKSLSITNICEVIQLAFKHSDGSVLESAKEYFMNNVLDIMRTVEWQSFLKDNTAVGNELLMKSIKKFKT